MAAATPLRNALIAAGVAGGGDVRTLTQQQLRTCDAILASGRVSTFLSLSFSQSFCSVKNQIHPELGA